MKKIFILLLISTSVFCQNLISSNVNDTLSVDALGLKIERENDLAKCEIWNNEIMKVSQERKEQKTLKSDIKFYYEKAYFFSLINQAYFEREKGNIKKEIENYYIIIRKADETKHGKALAFTYRAIGGAFVKENDLEKAEIYYRKAIKFVTADIDQTVLGQIMNALGNVQMKQKKYDLALETYYKSLKIKIPIKNPNEISTSYNSIAQAYIAKENYDSATVYLNKSIYESKISNQYYLLSDSYNRLAFILKNKGNLEQHNQFKKLAFDYAKKAKDLDLIFEVGLDFYQQLKKNGKYQLALSVLESAIQAKDTLYKSENKSAALKAEFKYETELKEAEIKTLAQQKQISELQSTRKSTLIYSILGGILALAVIAYFSFTRFKAKKANELLSSQLVEAQKRIEIEQKATESELKALKSQMNPHFMFNALNSIQEQFMYGNKLIANEQMSNFTDLTRQILTVSGKKKINLSSEIEILTKYLELEKMRFSEGFSYEIILDQKIDEDYHQIPPMLIQPFVENAIKHGLLHKQGNKKLSVSFALDALEEHLICIVEDNGVGRIKSAEIKNKRTIQHESFSTSATSERLKLLSNDFENNDFLIFEDLQSLDNESLGTKVTIKIPIVA